MRILRLLPALSAALVMLAAGPASAGHLTTLYTFCTESGCPDGAGPHQIMLDARGNLVGATFDGGADIAGTVFQLRPKGRRFKLIHSFCSHVRHDCRDGEFAFGAPTADSQGNLYAGTEHGGRREGGVIYKLTPHHQGYSFRVIHDFCAMAHCADGRGSDGTFAIDAAGNIYGTAFAGGAHEAGVFFELSPGADSWTYKVLYDFCARRHCADGKEPLNGLTYAGASSGAPYDGHSPLYGTTHVGGLKNHGVVFELTRHKGEWKEKILFRFCPHDECSGGAYPASYGALALDGAGNIYGTTGVGGAQNGGTIYKLAPASSGWTETVLYDFCPQSNCTDYVEANPVLDVAGNLIGTNNHTLYKLDMTSGRLKVLHQFCTLPNCSDGDGLEANVVMNAAGDFFGTTSGTIFEYKP